MRIAEAMCARKKTSIAPAAPPTCNMSKLPPAAVRTAQKVLMAATERMETTLTLADGGALPICRTATDMPMAAATVAEV